MSRKWSRPSSRAPGSRWPREPRPTTAAVWPPMSTPPPTPSFRLTAPVWSSASTEWSRRLSTSRTSRWWGKGGNL